MMMHGERCPCDGKELEGIINSPIKEGKPIHDICDELV